MTAAEFAAALNTDFFCGVPDSRLRPFCDWLMGRYGLDPRHHVVTACEGNAVAVAAGWAMATGRIPVVYMQNSGLGNAINPAVSLLHERVYGIPMIFIIGWRGEPGLPDEPQHAWQGEITLQLLEDMQIASHPLGPGSAPAEAEAAMDKFSPLLAAGRQVAFVIRKDALTLETKRAYSNPFSLKREDALRVIISVTGDDPLICTTGKASRELFELREALGQGHERDFLTVGSMGHASSIALGAALGKPGARVWCIDGDGSALMHMGSLAIIGKHAPASFMHIILNNQAHESVGGIPTAADDINFCDIARACGYKNASSVQDRDALYLALDQMRHRNGPNLLEVKVAIGARADLGRPTTTPQQNKAAFMRYLEKSGAPERNVTLGKDQGRT